MVSKVLKINEYEKDDSGDIGQCIISALKELKSMADEGVEESESSDSSSSDSDNEEDKKTKNEAMVETSQHLLFGFAHLCIYNFPGHGTGFSQSALAFLNTQK